MRVPPVRLLLMAALPTLLSPALIPLQARAQSEQPVYADIQVRPEEGLVRGAAVIVTGVVEVVGSAGMTELAVRVPAGREREAELILLTGPAAQALATRQNRIMHIEGLVMREPDGARPAVVRVLEARDALRPADG